MSKTKWYQKPIYALVALALVLSLAIVAVPMVGTVEADPGDYYVATSGNDTSGDGSEGNPWRTIQHAVDTVNATDTINVADGTYNENILVNKSLTLQAASSPIIDGGGTLWVPAVEIAADDVTLQGFTIQNFEADAAHDLAAVFVHGDNARIKDNIIKDITSGAYGIGIDVQTEWAKNVQITNNTVHDVGSIGIRVRDNWVVASGVSSNTLVKGNTVYRTGNSGVLITGYVQGVTIEDNEIYDSLGPTYYNLFVHYGASDITIGGEGNYIHDAYANIVLAGCDNVSIKDNTIEDATLLPSNPSVKGKNIYILNDYNSWTGTPDTLSTGIDIVGNDILNADGWGVRIRNIGAADPTLMATTTTINCNNIAGNTEYGVENMIPTDVDATHNWWGDASGPSTSPGSGDKVSDNVIYDPWLTMEFQYCEVCGGTPPPPVGGEAYPVNKISVLAPWIAMGLVLAGGISWLTLRRRRAEN